MGRPKRTSASVALDKQLAASALQKQRAGEQPTGKEIAALRRVEAEREEVLRQEFCRTIPAKHWRDWSGRPDKVRNEQAERYGIPFGGAVIDLTRVVPAIHAFFAKYAKILARARGDDDDPLMTGGNSPNLELYRGYKAELAHMDVEERQANLLRREVVHSFLVQVASRLREAGEQLQRQCGAEAYNILDDALHDMEQMIERNSELTG